MFRLQYPANHIKPKYFNFQRKGKDIVLNVMFPCTVIGYEGRSAVAHAYVYNNGYFVSWKQYRNLFADWIKVPSYPVVFFYIVIQLLKTR